MEGRVLTPKELALANQNNKKSKNKRKPRQPVPSSVPQKLATNARPRRRGFFPDEHDKPETLDPTAKDPALPIFVFPLGLCVSREDSALYVADNMQHMLKKIDTDDTVSLIAGRPRLSDYTPADGPVEEAVLRLPSYVALDTNGDIYFTETNSLRRLSKDGEVVTLVSSYVSDEEKILFGMILTPKRQVIIAYGEFILRIDPDDRSKDGILPHSIAPSCISHTNPISDRFLVSSDTGVYLFSAETGLMHQVIPWTNSIPCGIATDIFGNIYYTHGHPSNHVGIIIDGQCRPIFTKTMTSKTRASRPMLSPGFLIIDHRGNGYFTEHALSRVNFIHWKKLTPQLENALIWLMSDYNHETSEPQLLPELKREILLKFWHICKADHYDLLR